MLRTELPKKQEPQEPQESPSEQDLLVKLSQLTVGSQEWVAVRDSITEKYVGLIMIIAEAFRKKRNCTHDDLIQAGFLGLLRAIERFDLSRKVKLSTYACYSIRHEMQRVYGSQCFPIRVCSRDLARLRKYDKDLESASGSAKASRKFLAATRIKAAISSLAPEGSCDSLIANPEEDPFGLSDSQIIVDMLISHLDPREKKVLFLRHGFDGAGSRTLKEVGRELGLTRSRSQQIEAGAIEKIRQSADFLACSHFLEEK